MWVRRRERGPGLNDMKVGSWMQVRGGGGGISSYGFMSLLQ